MKWTAADQLWQTIFEDRGIVVSKEWAREEAFKCSRDPIYFINQYGLVRNRAEDMDALPPGCKIYGDMLDFVLFDIQETYLKSVIANQNNVAVKTRQSGISVSTGLFLLHQATFRNNKVYIVLSKSEREAMKFLDDVKSAYKYLPFFLRRPCFETNKKTLALGGEYDASFLRVLTSGKGSGRSYTATMLVMDEAAFIPDAQSIWAASSPILTTTGGKALIISTPWEDQGLFYDMVQGAKGDRNNFTCVEIPWRSIPGRDENWYQRECEKLQHITTLIQTELDMKFIRRGTSFFSDDRLRALPNPHIIAQIAGPTWSPTAPEDAIELNEFHDGVSMPVTGVGNMMVFKKPGHIYMVSHDPAEDASKSKHGIAVFDITGFPAEPPEIVLEYMTAENQFALLVDLSIYFDAIVVVEKNRGYAVIQHFIGEGEDKRLFTRPNGQTGIVTNAATREMLLKIISKYISIDLEAIPPLLQHECKSFIKDNRGKLKGRDGDDMIFAVGIGLLGLTLYPDLFGLGPVTEDSRRYLIQQVKSLAGRNIPGKTTDRYLDELKDRLNISKNTRPDLKKKRKVKNFGLPLPG